MNLSKKIIISFVVCAIIMATILTYSINLFAQIPIDENTDNTPIILLTEKSEVKDFKVKTAGGLVVKNIEEEKKYIEKNKKIIETQINVLSPDTFNSAPIKDKSNVIIDESLVDNPQIKDKAKKMFDNGARIAFKQTNITIDKIADFLGLDKSIMPLYPYDSTQSILKTIGYIVYKCNNSTVLFTVREQNYNDDKTNLETIIWGLKSRVYERSNGLLSSNNLLKKNVVNAEASGWTPIQTIQPVGGDSYTEGNVAWSLQLLKYPSNPTPDGKWWSANSVKTETIAKPGSGGWIAFEVASIEVTQMQGRESYGMVYDYEPKQSSASSPVSVSFSYPWGLSFSWSPSTNTGIRLNGGGMSREYTNIKFTNNGLGARDYLNSASVVEFWQDTTNCYKYNGTDPYPNYFQATMGYFVTFTRDAPFYSENVTYVNDQFPIANGY